MTFKVKSGIRVNTVDVIDQHGNFTGNAYLGQNPVSIENGGTNATSAANARINLFGDITPDGLLVKTSGGVFSTAILAGTGITVTDGTGVSGSPTVAIDANADVTFNNVTVTGTLFSNDITASHITADGDLFVTGNLIILGETTTLNTQDVLVEDNEIILNANVTGAPVLDAFVTINRGDEPAANVKWDETIDRWQFTNDGTNYYNIPIPEEYDNVIYRLSTETGQVSGQANLRLQGTKSNGNVLLTDDIKLIGAGLVNVFKSGSNEITINASGSLSEFTDNILDSVANVAYYFYSAEFFAAEIMYSAYSLTAPTKRSTGKIMILCDGTNTFNNQYAMLQSDPNDEVILFTTDLNNGNVRLLAQSTTGNESHLVLTGINLSPV